MVDPRDALKGRSTPMNVDAKHYILSNAMEAPWPAGLKVTVLANGCFWGSEKGFWRLPGGGIYSTAVGYCAGFTPNPTYEEVCSGQTGHTEAVQVVYDPSKISLVDILRWFWQSHDPTQGMAQGHDFGTQYRSGVYYTDDEQRALIMGSKAAYSLALEAAGHTKPITTEVAPLGTFYYAEAYHQQYLAKPGARPYCSAQPLSVSLPPFERWAPEPLAAAHAPKLPEGFWDVHAPSPHCVIRSPHKPIAVSSYAPREPLTPSSEAGAQAQAAAPAAARPGSRFGLRGLRKALFGGSSPRGGAAEGGSGASLPAAAAWEVAGPVVGDESIMRPKEHGTSHTGVQGTLRWQCDVKVADRICNYNRRFAEHSGYFLSTGFVRDLHRAEREGERAVDFFDSNSGEPLFRAPLGRSYERFLSESKKHGWPSFRDAEVNWERVRVLPDGECVSVEGTHLGHNLPDGSGNRYCINLVSVAGYASKQ